MEEPEEDLIPNLHGEICPPVGTQCRPEARKDAETAGTGEVNQEVGVREADKLPEIVVPDVTLKRVEEECYVSHWGIPVVWGCDKYRYEYNSGNPVR
ncbi:hypothetical protein NDU88_006161 [Pleurodeles waltl]|uniref:Uncharacterized protein n=1 Tax=Pleurodeles waltl TaxID=8319 RepID=A0AAV7RPH5_PLEWA|nr:hypothetical protein NDU88_006161 [Pleurodeles waltl]